MSRSYKDTAYAGDKKDKFFKNYANRKLRQNKHDVSNGKQYRKYFNTWEIYEDHDMCSFEEYYNYELKRHEEYKMLGLLKPDSKYPDKQKCYRDWYKYYKMK